jgi:hypothetical protein
MFGFLKALAKKSRSRSPRLTKPARPAGLRLEALEDRTVPSYMVMDVPGSHGGVYLLDTGQYRNDSKWLTGVHANKLAVDNAGDVVGSFGSAGVWAYGNNGGSTSGWHQLKPWQACSVAIAGEGNGFNVAASFPGHGLYEFSDNSPTQLTSAIYTPSLAGIDTSGNVVAEIPRYGVYYHPEYGNWQQIASADATILAYTGGWVAGYFPGHGVFRELVGQTGWQGITGIQPTALAVDGNGDVVGNYAGYGVWYASPSGTSSQWTNTNMGGATYVGMNSGEVGAYINGSGVYSYNTSTGEWTRLLSVQVDDFAFGG